MFSNPTRPSTLKKVAEVFEVAVPDSLLVPVFNDRTPNVPAIDPNYVFDRAQLKKVLQWLSGAFGNNLLLTGPTGCGKSSLIEQVCARLNMEVWRVACHGKLEFPELVSSVQLVAQGAMAQPQGLVAKASAAIKSLFKGAEDGESLLEWLQRTFSTGVVTRVVPGPAVLAAQRGGILLLDEANFLHPSTVGAFNTVMDGGTIAIPDTGEVVVPEPSFRIAVTGNSMDGGEDLSLHRGVQRMNVALMNRFLCMRCDYMDTLQEAQVIGKAVTLPGSLVEVLLSVAKDTRNAFKTGAIETTVSTRVLCRWAKLLAAVQPALADPKTAQPAIVDALDFALLAGANPTDRDSIVKVLEKAVGNRGFTAKGATAAAKGSSASSTTPGTAKGVSDLQLRIWVHPNPGQPAPKYWGGYCSNAAAVDEIFYNQFGSNPNTESKASGYIARKSSEKQRDGYVEVMTIQTLRAVPLLVDAATWWNQVAMGSTVSIPNVDERNWFTDLLAKSGRGSQSRFVTA